MRNFKAKKNSDRQNELRYNGISKSNYQKLRLVVLAQEGQCRKCFQDEGLIVMDNLEMDHIIPLVEGGTNRRENLQALCKKCHRKKTAVEQGWTIGSCIHGVLHTDKCPKCNPEYRTNDT